MVAKDDPSSELEDNPPPLGQPVALPPAQGIAPDSEIGPGPAAASLETIGQHATEAAADDAAAGVSAPAQNAEPTVQDPATTFPGFLPAKIETSAANTDAGAASAGAALAAAPVGDPTCTDTDGTAALAGTDGTATIEDCPDLIQSSTSEESIDEWSGITLVCPVPPATGRATSRSAPGGGSDSERPSSEDGAQSSCGSRTASLSCKTAESSFASAGTPARPAEQLQGMPVSHLHFFSYGLQM